MWARKKPPFPVTALVFVPKFQSGDYLLTDLIPLHARRGNFVVKAKLSGYRNVGAKRDRRYSSYSSSTLALEGVSSQRPATVALYPRERTPGTHWIRGWLGLGFGLDTEATGKILFLCRHPAPVQSVVRHYTDWAKPAPGNFEVPKNANL
jgi:hypothetical protein